MTDPRFTDKEMALILRRAVELSSGEERQHSLADIQRIASEIGIAPDVVVRAAALPLADPEQPSRLWGASSANHLTRVVARAATPQNLSTALAQVRARLAVIGESREIAGGMDWRYDSGFSTAAVTIVTDETTTSIDVAGRADGTQFVIHAGALAAAVLTGFIATTATTPEFSAAVALGSGIGYLGVARLWWNRIAAANQRRMRALADEVAALLERG